MKITDCLNDLWDYFFLGDPANVSKFKLENKLSDNLIQEFTTNISGDLVVEKGVLIPMSGVENYPYHIFFTFNAKDTAFNNHESDLQFRKKGYILEVISNEIYLMTIPYLQLWNVENGIEKLTSNTIRPRIPLENGVYHVEILGGETKQSNGWEPTFEFILTKSNHEISFDVQDVGFKFQIDSREY